MAIMSSHSCTTRISPDSACTFQALVPFRLIRKYALAQLPTSRCAGRIGMASIDEIVKFLKDHGHTFFHFTDRKNLPGIRQHGILSMHQVRAMGLQVPATGGNQWSLDADAASGMDGCPERADDTHRLVIRSVFARLTPLTLDTQQPRSTVNACNSHQKGARRPPRIGRRARTEQPLGRRA